MNSDERSALALAAVSSALAPVFRGKLCDNLLATRDPRMFERHAVLYDLGETDRSLFFIRSGIVKTGTITQGGREIIYDVRKNAKSWASFAPSTRRDAIAPWPSRRQAQL